MNAKTEAARAEAASPVIDPSLAAAFPTRRESVVVAGSGLAVFVIVLVLIATITFSLLLRRPPQSGEGLSMARPTATPGAGAWPRVDDARVRAAVARDRLRDEHAHMRPRCNGGDSLVIARHARDRSARRELRRGGSDRDAVRPRHGTAVGAGARRTQEPERFAGGLALCALGSAAVRERAGAELATLERFDATDSHAALGTDVARMAHAAYAAELVGKLCAPRQVETAVFDWLSLFLRLLDSDGASAERLRVFEIGLLSGLGFGPVLDTCAVCAGANFAGRTASEVAFRWDPDRGGAVCTLDARGGRPLQPAVREALIRLARTPLEEATASGVAGRRQPRLPRGAARDHQPSRERSAQDRRIHCQGRAGGRGSP